MSKIEVGHYEFRFVATGGVRDDKKNLGTSDISYDNQEQYLTVELLSDYGDIPSVYRALNKLLESGANGHIVGGDTGVPNRIYEWSIRKPKTSEDVESDVKLICHVTYRILVER